MTILLLDNYDSFTYNLYQYIAELGGEVQVHRNDQISIADIHNMAPEKIVLSPGPGRPEEAGLMMDVIQTFHESTPIFGVCLGHQALGLAFGSHVVHAPCLMHGKTSPITHDEKGVFKDVPQNCEITRYHSLVVDTPPENFIATAHTSDGTLMAMRHTTLPLEGVQFHPESIFCDHGKTMVKNFLECA